MTSERPYGLFQAFGVELEYMIVDQQTLNVSPCSDLVLQEGAGEITGEWERGKAAWSNELALHVLEFKVSEPVPNLDGLTELFQQQVRDANAMLHRHGCRLMPTAMHPWMRPETEMKLWPHDYNPVYEAFHRIFDCRGHGWANLQSTHWNFPFRDDQEFGKLHAAIRLVLPLLPGLAASSPIYDATRSGFLDSRLDVYQSNSKRIPSIAGKIVPEGVYTEADYESKILLPMYRDISPLDPEGILQHIWLNARGAIARFDRGSIEVRVLDIQENPAADMAIGTLMAATLRALCNEHWLPWKSQASVSTDVLAKLLQDAIRVGPAAIVPESIACHFGCGMEESVTIGALWNSIIQQLDDFEAVLEGPLRECLETILHEGTLSQRILSSLEGDVSPNRLHRVYEELCDCLEDGTMFHGD
ncbi:MAG: glutamate-cysteine ligase family protein [Pirellulales bacterium]